MMVRQSEQLFLCGEPTLQPPGLAGSRDDFLAPAALGSPSVLFLLFFGVSLQSKSIPI